MVMHFFKYKYMLRQVSGSQINKEQNFDETTKAAKGLQITKGSSKSVR